MPSSAKAINTTWLLIGWLLCAETSWAASQFAAQIRQASIVASHNTKSIVATIDYPLSPSAREALQKGVALTWILRFELRQPGSLWDSVLYRGSVPFTLQFHALLNQYEVRSGEHIDMFLSLHAALNYMASPKLPLPESEPAKHATLLAIKSQFNRESLPIPLRPMAYLNEQWFLSSDWTTWPITE